MGLSLENMDTEFDNGFKGSISFQPLRNTCVPSRSILLQL